MRAIAVYTEVSSANFGDGSDKPADTRVLWVVGGGNGCIGAVVRGCSDCGVFVQRIFQAAEPGVSRGPWSDFAGLHGVQSGAGIQRAAGGAVAGSCGRAYRDSDRYRAARLGMVCARFLGAGIAGLYAFFVVLGLVAGSVVFP
jgi:hypothetical protein